MSRLKSCGLGAIASLVLVGRAVLGEPLAQQYGAMGIVTYDLPPVTETQTTPVPVPYAWLDAHVPGVAQESEAYEAAASSAAANGRPVWACYALDLDPQVATNDFRIVSFPMKADGTPDLEAIEVDPPPSRWNVPGARSVLKGAASLDAGTWPTVTDENKSSFRFFKAAMELP